jgi:hypothetical protein
LQLHGSDAHGRAALLRYVLRPPIAQDRIEQGQDGLIRILLKKPLPRPDYRSRAGSALAPVSYRRKRSSATPPHRQVRRRPRSSERMEIA